MQYNIYKICVSCQREQEPWEKIAKVKMIDKDR